ncbi:MAG: sigma-70 family RNA polymerase sigma factor [Bosea sp.]|nr:sigma-70 family RNA polymerase sigma factor [Bosea sp. (in: a-proteobacteria)]
MTTKTSDQAEDVERALVARLKAGDGRAIDMLMQRHATRLRMLARRMLGRNDEADDLVQDAFIALWRQADRLDPERGAIGAWLTRVVVNRAIDRARRARFLRFIGLDSAPDTADDVPDPEQAASARSEIAAVRADLEALPPRQRAAILLAAEEEASTASIAEALGLSAGAAEQLLVRGRRTLRLAAMKRAEAGETTGKAERS